MDIKDNVVDEGFYFTPKGDDPCLSCTCHGGEPELCVAALCERPQGCQQYRKDPKECCKFMCLDPGEAHAWAGLFCARSRLPPPPPLEHFCVCVWCWGQLKKKMRRYPQS